MNNWKLHFDELRIKNNLSKYKKISPILFRVAKPNEFIITVCNSKIETVRKCFGNEIIIQSIQIGTSAENYVIEKEKFIKRYEELGQTCIFNNEEYKFASPKGFIEAVEWDGDEFIMVVPWGEMFVEKGDMIAHPIDGDEDDFYRIAQKEFKQTYKAVL